MADGRPSDVHPYGSAGRQHPETGVTVAELRNLLGDCLVLWGVSARLEPVLDGVAVHAPDGCYRVQQAPEELRPARWFLLTPERAAANRPARSMPSVVALLSALRNALGADGGARLRVGG
jgi:hypothetical protein